MLSITIETIQNEAQTIFNDYEAVEQLKVASYMHNWSQSMRGKRQDRKNILILAENFSNLIRTRNLWIQESQ